MSTAASKEYLKNAVMTATPEQLHLMLYDGAIRFALKGREAIETGQFEETYNTLTRAQKIILELQNGLNHDIDRTLCERMSGLYTFVYRKLVDATINKDVSAVDEAVQVLRHLRETWVMLMEKLKEEAPGLPTDDSSTESRSPPPAALPANPVPSDHPFPEGSLNIEG